VGRIKKSQGPIDKSQSGIKRQSVSSPRISFSCKYLDLEHRKFSINGRDFNYLSALLQRLKDLSSWQKLTLLTNGSKSLRCHPIDWDKVTESGFGLPNEDELVDKPYQFQLSSNEHGRVHGFFIDEIFYVVWLDPEHKLYP
jgi:hypothetical protein